MKNLQYNKIMSLEGNGEIRIYGPTGDALRQRGSLPPGSDGFRVSHRDIVVTVEELTVGSIATELFDRRFRRSQPWTVLGNQFGETEIIDQPNSRALQEQAIGIDGGNAPQIALHPEVKITRIKAMQEERISPKMARIMETFFIVERYLPDFSRASFETYRNYRGMTDAYYQWSHEENYHGILLRAILIATGSRTADEMDRLEELLLHREWIPPFEFQTPRRMTIYAALQERVTRDAYGALANCIEEDAPLAAEALRLIRSDEAFHGAWFGTMAREYYKLDPVGTAQDASHVFSHFRMPADMIAPDGAKRGIELKHWLGIHNGSYARKLYGYMTREVRLLSEPEVRILAANYGRVNTDNPQLVEALLAAPRDLTGQIDRKKL